MSAYALAGPTVGATGSERGGLRELHVSPRGVDGGRCTRASPCRSFDRAYRLAAAGDVVLLHGGTYPGQVIAPDARKLNAKKEIVFTPLPGATVVVNGDLDMRGSHAVFRGEQREDGSWSFRVRKVRSEIVAAATASRHVVFEELKAETFMITGSSFITLRGGDYGPGVACWPRGTTGPGPSGGEITESMWCPAGSGYERSGNTDAYQPKIGPNGAVPGVWPHHIVIDGITLHDQNSLDYVNLHNGGIFIVSGHHIVVQNSRFYGNIVYDLFAHDFTTPECCRMTFGAARDVLIRNNRFEAPVDAALQPGGNGWTSRVRNELPEIHLRPTNGQPWRRWTIARNSFDNGISLGFDAAPTFAGVRVTRNVGGGGECYAGQPGILWAENASASECSPFPVPIGYRIDRGRLVPGSAAGAVRFVFRLAASGRTPAWIARAVRRATRSRLTTSAVRRMLENRAYLGNAVGPPGAHPGLVSQEVWAASRPRGR